MTVYTAHLFGTLKLETFFFIHSFLHADLLFLSIPYLFRTGLLLGCKKIHLKENETIVANYSHQNEELVFDH